MGMIDRKRIFRNHETLFVDARVQGSFVTIYGRPMKSEPHGQILHFSPRDCTNGSIR
jgi:hypothetical protein